MKTGKSTYVKAARIMSVVMVRVTFTLESGYFEVSKIERARTNFLFCRKDSLEYTSFGERH